MTHPIDEALADIFQPPSGLTFPPNGWTIIKEWGYGYALQKGGLRLLIDTAIKRDGYAWVHISVSRAKWVPTHEDMASVKQDFLGDRYAYSVWAPSEKHVNIHPTCLHLWSRVDDSDGMVLPEFSEVVEGVGLSI